MAKKKATADEDVKTPAPEQDPEASAPSTEDVKAPAKKVKATGPITVKYRDHVGQPTERTFSEEVHGENFAELAEEFKATNASRIIKE